MPRILSHPDLMSAASLHAGELPEGSFGHTGFTGTSIVASPQTGLILVLLTNRQHVGVDENGLYPNLREIRRAIWDLVKDRKFGCPRGYAVHSRCRGIPCEGVFTHLASQLYRIEQDSLGHAHPAIP